MDTWLYWLIQAGMSIVQIAAIIGGMFIILKRNGFTKKVTSAEYAKHTRLCNERFSRIDKESAEVKAMLKSIKKRLDSIEKIITKGVTK
jgi:uncharacterized membrane protein